MNRSNTAIFMLLMLGSTSSGVVQSADPTEELKACAKITDGDARFACFDNLGERVLQDESADKNPTQQEMATSVAVTQAAESSAQPPADDLGVSEVEEDQKSKNVTYSGMVTSCKEGHYGDWYFTFDNGEVWKEVVERDLRFKECNFGVTITKDFFGYKMNSDAFEKPIRIKRYQ